MHKELITFKNIPLSNELLYNKEDKTNYYDLKVGFDTETKLVSLYDNVSSEKMFNETYVYDSSQSKTMIDHFKQAAISLQDKFKCSKPLEIGSNSGIFIKHFSKNTSVAVEPCTNFAEITEKNGIKTYGEYWGDKVANKIIKEHGKRDLIYSANTISHIQNLDECFKNVYKCLDDNGVFVIESPSFLELLKGNAFDQFYHEHQSYFSCIALNNILEKHNLKIFDLELYPVHGGTYRFFITKDNYLGHTLSPNVTNFIEQENVYGLDDYKTLKKRINVMVYNMNKIKAVITSLKEKGATIAGYGATAKFTQITNMCELNSDLIDYALDTTPDKQNKYIPKSKIKILPYKKEKMDDIGYCFLGAWNYKDEIITKESQFLRSGGTFITHVPTVQLITMRNKQLLHVEI